MHVIQKRAIIAIISMIESGLREIRAVLTDGTPTPVDEPRYSKPEPLLRPDSPLSDDEEVSLEKMMEENRQQMLQQNQDFLRRAYDDAEDLDYLDGGKS